MKKANIEYILDEMNTLFGDYPATELLYKTPFQLLLAVMLSAQTTDKQVNKVTKYLFKKIKSPGDVVHMGLEKFGKAICSIGLWRGKARNIVKMSEILLKKSDEHKRRKGSLMKKKLDQESEEIRGSISTKKESLLGALLREGSDLFVYRDSGEILEKFGYWIPDSLEEMMKLPGVGIKTAKVVLYVLYKQRWVAVDTHVHRVMNRLGVVSTKFPEKTSQELEKIIPDTYKGIAHHVIIYFGRYLCKARKPECERCPLLSYCKRYREGRE